MTVFFVRHAQFWDITGLVPLNFPTATVGILWNDLKKLSYRDKISAGLCHEAGRMISCQCSIMGYTLANSYSLEMNQSSAVYQYVPQLMCQP